MKQNNDEFVGDRIFALAAIQLVENHFRNITPQQSMNWCMELTENKNFECLIFHKSKALHPNKVEARIGRVYKDKGLIVALGKARELLTRTKKFNEILMYQKPLEFNK